jgi:integral membrane protein (TIGR01906 family)
VTHVIPLIKPTTLARPARRARRVVRRLAGAGAALIVGTATALVILGFSVFLLLNPLWVSSEQDRAESGILTGYGPDDLNHVTGSILYDLVIGPPDFAVQVNGQPVLNDRERGHLRDVRTVFIVFAGLVLAAAIVLIGARLATRGSRPFWGRVRRGARLLAALTVIAAAIAIFFFQPAFELFHRMLFPAGSFDFDPKTDRLVQLFPEQFWTDTTLVLGATMFVAAVLVAHLAGERAAGPRPDRFAAARAIPSSRPAS